MAGRPAQLLLRLLVSQQGSTHPRWPAVGVCRTVGVRPLAGRGSAPAGPAAACPQSVRPGLSVLGPAAAGPAFPMPVTVSDSARRPRAGAPGIRVMIMAS